MRCSLLLAAALASTVLSTFSTLPARSQEPFEFVGDPELLEFLRTAQAANKARYARGEMRVTYEDAHDTGGGFKVVALMIWDGDKTFLDFERTFFLAGSDRSKVAAEAERCLRVDNNRTTFTYFTNQRIASEWSSATNRDRLLQLHPATIWHCILPHGGIDFEGMFDVRTPESPGRRGLSRCVVTQEGDDLVTIDRYMVQGAQLQIVASLAKDGNVVAFRSFNSNVLHDAKISWVPTDSGAWRLALYDQNTRFVGMGPEFPKSMQTLVTVESFDESPTIAPDRFETSSLNLPPDTEIYDIDPKGKRTIRPGTKRARTVQQTLDLLAVRLGAHGLLAKESDPE